MTRTVKMRVPTQAAVLKALVVVSLAGSVLGLIAVAVVDWIMFRLHDELLATDSAVPAELLSAETWMMILLNVGVALAIAMNLVGIWLMFRGGRKNNAPDQA